MKNSLISSDIGRKVVYKSFTGNEEGVITSYNESYVFVRYGSDTGSQATRYEDLSFI